MNYRTRQKIFIIFTVLLIGISFSGMVHGATSIGPDFICSGDNTIEEDIGNLVYLVMFGSPVAGSLIYFFSRAGESIGIKDTKNIGKTAAKSGFVTPIAIYGLEWVVDLAFGVNFGCLLPGAG